MGYSLSLEMGARGKMTAKNKGVMIAHAYRKSLNNDIKHSNTNIDKSKTKYNSDIVFYRHDNGEMMTLDEAIDFRLRTEYAGKRKVRKDAVLVRELIAQPDPKMFEGLSDEAKRELALKFADDTLYFMLEEFKVKTKDENGNVITNSKNLMGLSLHMDEENPHVHVAIMPMTADGRLSQKDFFKGPQDMRLKHERYRSFMNDKGWNFNLENKHENAEHVKTEAFKKNAKQIEADRQAYTDEIRRAKHKPDVRNEAKRELKDELRDETYEEAYQEALQNANNRVLSDFNANKEKELEEREKALKSKEKAINEVIEEYREKSSRYDEKVSEYRKAKEDLVKREKAIEAKRLKYARTFNETMNEVAHVLPVYDGKLRNRTQTILDRDLEPTPEIVIGTVDALARNVSNNSMRAIKLINDNIRERNNQKVQQQPKQQDQGIEL